MVFWNINLIILINGNLLNGFYVFLQKIHYEIA